MTEKQNAAMNQAIDLLINNDTDVSSLFKEDGLLKELTKRLVEKALQSEMNNHLGYSKYNQSDAQNWLCPNKCVNCSKGYIKENIT
ncbi:transposase domain protein [Rickettsia hoogstraalii str. RCCE3]|nr:transposase domain protein [Rickettsia hoogstraalii str. RCCE3]